MIVQMYRERTSAFWSVHSDLDLAIRFGHRYVKLILLMNFGSCCTSARMSAAEEDLDLPVHVGYVKLYAAGFMRTSSIPTSSA